MLHAPPVNFSDEDSIVIELNVKIKFYFFKIPSLLYVADIPYAIEYSFYIISVFFLTIRYFEFILYLENQIGRIY